jgi:cell division transport system permease protein
MKVSTFTRHWREGFKSVVRNGWMTFASVGAIAISLLVLGVFLLLALNVNYIASQIESEVEVRVFLEMNTTQTQVEALHNAIGSIDNVKKITFVSKEEGLEILRETLGEENRGVLDGLDQENPLPDSFTVEVVDPMQVSAVAAQISALNDGKVIPPIMKVDYGHGTVETLFKITRMVRNIGLILVAGLAFTAMFLIANTIKLTITARRREISIMKLVGATNSFIRGPFFVEGAILGIMGSVIPVGILIYGYYELLITTRVDLGLMMIKLLPLQDVVISMTWLLMGIGIVIGIWGSTLSIRKFLKV